MPSVSVIIVTYNSEKVIRENLDSLNNQSFKDFEVIIVENFSQDNTKFEIETFKKNAKFTMKTIYLKENTGFAVANNIALKKSSAPFIALINPDAKAEYDWLEQMLLVMKQRSEVGICASKVLNWDGTKIDSAGDIMFSSLRAFKRGEGKAAEQFSSSSYIFGACGAAGMYRKKMIDEIGFFDEDFFIQCEDTDLSFRCQLADWKIFYQAQAKIYHKVSQSIIKIPDIAIYYTQRNLEFVRIKNVPFIILLFFLPQMITGFILDFLYSCVKRKQYKMFFKAKLNVIKMMPIMLRKRKKIQKLKKVKNSYVFSLISFALKNVQFICFKLKKFFLKI